MNKEENDSEAAINSPEVAKTQVFWGAFLGLISAVGYTGANVFLRALVDCDPVWVSCMKAVPTLLLIGPWLIVLAAKRIRIIPPRKILLSIVLGALIGHLAGNVLFQWSLGIIGMALAVPITLGSIIVGGAILGRMFLGETITNRSLWSMLVLIVSIFVLSLGAGDAHTTMKTIHTNSAIGVFELIAGLAAAAIAGIAYAALGVVIRRGVTGHSTVSMTMLMVSVVGFLSLGIVCYFRLGWSVVFETSSQDYGIMILAGICNAVAFLTLTRALQLTTVTYINSLNASQAAMAAMAGVVIFHEAISTAMIVGVVMTSLGLVMMKGRDQTDRHTIENDP